MTQHNQRDRLNHSRMLTATVQREETMFVIRQSGGRMFLIENDM